MVAKQGRREDAESGALQDLRDMVKAALLEVQFRPASGLPDRRQSVLGYYAATFALGPATAVFGPTLPGLANQTHTDLRTVSFLFTARAFGYMLGSMQSGCWYDHWPGHAVLAAGLLLMAVTIVLTPLKSFLGALTATRTVGYGARFSSDLVRSTYLIRLAPLSQLYVLGSSQFPRLRRSVGSLPDPLRDDRCPLLRGIVAPNGVGHYSLKRDKFH
jgi:hypothetical protein